MVLTRRVLVTSVSVFALLAAEPLDGATLQMGLASWYGDREEGRRMANGERFHAAGLTAASRRLPLGTRVRVTHIGNGRSVVVPITDRGPFVAGRIIDLSLGAARKLGIEHDGLAYVRVEVVERPEIVARAR